MDLGDLPGFIAMAVAHLVYRVLMTTFALPKLVAVARPKDPMKFVHRLFDLIHYTASMLLGIVALAGQPYWECFAWSRSCSSFWLPNPSDCFVSYIEKIYYMNFCAYYIVDLLYIWTTPSDIVVMTLHHFVTIAMIFMAIGLHVPVLGLVIMLLHDVVDVPLYTGKILTYLGYTVAKEVLLATFASLCTWFRMVNFPWIVWQCFRNYPIIPRWRIWLYKSTWSLLLFLMTCHCIWYSKILKAAGQLVMGRSDAIRDNRSD
jgi:ceramide synthetase